MMRVVVDKTRNRVTIEDGGSIGVLRLSAIEHIYMRPSTPDGFREVNIIVGGSADSAGQFYFRLDEIHAQVLVGIVAGHPDWSSPDPHEDSKNVAETLVLAQVTDIAKSAATFMAVSTGIDDLKQQLDRIGAAKGDASIIAESITLAGLALAYATRWSSGEGREGPRRRR